MARYTKHGLKQSENAYVASEICGRTVKELKKIARHLGVPASDYNHMHKEDLINRVNCVVCTRGVSRNTLDAISAALENPYWIDKWERAINVAENADAEFVPAFSGLMPDVAKFVESDIRYVEKERAWSQVKKDKDPWCAPHAYRILMWSISKAYGESIAKAVNEAALKQFGLQSTAGMENYFADNAFTYSHYMAIQGIAAVRASNYGSAQWSTEMPSINLPGDSGATINVRPSSFRGLRQSVLALNTKASPLYDIGVMPQPWLTQVLPGGGVPDTPLPQPPTPEGAPPPDWQPAPENTQPKPTPDNPRPEPKEPAMTEGLGLEGALQTMINSAIGDKVEKALTERGLTAESVEAVVERCISKIPNMPRVITPPDGDRPQLVHPSFERMMQVIAVGEVPYLFGPSGSGKTHGAGQFADMVEREHTIIPCNEEMTVTDLIGYRDMRGEYVESAFYRAFIGGHLITMDEADKAPGPVLVTLNSAIAQRVMMFPTGTQEAPDTTTFLFTGNTRMSGASATYSAGQRQDTSLTNRLQNVAWDYDERLESALTKAACESFEGSWPACKAWLEEVRKIREQIEKMGLSYIAGPRQSIAGAKLLSIGVCEEAVREQTIFGWMRPEDARRIRKEVY